MRAMGHVKAAAAVAVDRLLLFQKLEIDDDEDEAGGGRRRRLPLHSLELRMEELSVTLTHTFGYGCQMAIA